MIRDDDDDADDDYEWGWYFSIASAVLSKQASRRAYTPRDAQWATTKTPSQSGTLHLSSPAHVMQGVNIAAEKWLITRLTLHFAVVV